MLASAQNLIDAKRLSSMKPGAAVEYIILTPHFASASWRRRARLFRIAWQDVACVLLDNQPPEHVVR